MFQQLLELVTQLAQHSINYHHYRLYTKWLHITKGFYAACLYQIWALYDCDSYHNCDTCSSRIVIPQNLIPN